MKNSTALTIIFLLFFSANLHAQNFLSTHEQAILNENGDTIILRGMGLGAWILQEGYMLKTPTLLT